MAKPFFGKPEPYNRVRFSAARLGRDFMSIAILIIFAIRARYYVSKRVVLSGYQEGQKSEPCGSLSNG